MLFGIYFFFLVGEQQLILLLMKWIKKKLPTLLSGFTITAFACTAIYLVGLLIIVTGITDFGIGIDSSPNFGTLVFLISFSKAFLLITLYLFWNILQRMKQGLPFQNSVIKRFYILGLFVFTLPFVNWGSSILLTVLNIPLSQYVDLYIVDTTINRSASLLITGIMITAFAHVLKEGFHIYEEQKLTV